MLLLRLVVPVIGAGVMAAGMGHGLGGRWFFVVPVVNLLAIAVSIAWRSFASGMSTRDGRLRSGDIVPFFFATVGMLTLLLQEYLVPWMVWLL